MKFCEKCQKEFPDDVKFCGTCGGPLTEKQPAETADAFQMSSEGIVLHSGAPLSTKTGWCKWGYLASLIIGAVTGGPGLLLIFVVYFIEYHIIQFHRGKIRRMKFKFVSPVTADEVYNRLQPALTKKLGNAVEFDRDDDKVVVKYDSVIYDINLNEDGTMSVWWRKSLAGAFFSVREGKLYRKVRTGTALIAYELQQQFGVHE